MSFKQQRRKLSRQLAARVLPPLVWGLIRLLWKTCRIEAILGADNMQAARDSQSPFIPCYWHQQQIFCVRYLLDQADIDPGIKLGYLISPSADGDMATTMFANQGVHIIRGSATRGGAQALREIYQRIRQDGISPIVTPDGPTGPIYKTKPGVAMLAQLSKAPMLPLAYQASSAWQLRSWDHFFLPRPFSRIVIAIEPALSVTKADQADEFAAVCSRMDKRLNSASQKCAQYFENN